ncbi:methionine synthase [Fusobacterium perfoetens]|uniref:methionine synthase n=1 Tax=Fusobacterium perfoetens TaxID=852 RepID=UPI001F3719B8|nr:methionine synthase [Fusobacterium perfoetens]MCF2625487.1 methionine synthase [Fusobacterium perfoetens]
MNFTILKKELEKRILVLDGATGTAIQKYNLSDTDFLGKKGCSEILNITRPDIIKEIHLNYMKAGADIIETNSFNCNSISLSEYNLAEKSYEFSKISASIACEAVKNFSEISGKKIWIAGSVGPTSKSASIPTGDIPYEREISFDELKNSYSDQIRGLIDGGADIILIETIFDGLNAKAALIATEEIFEEKNKFFPVMISATVNKQGKLLSGQSIESLITALDREYIISFGLNCSFGAKDLVPLIKKLSSFTDKYISLYPNAGLPDENGEYKETPEITAEFLKELVEEKAVNILGGCCGTHFGHIKAISKLVSGKEPRKPSLSLKKTHLLSGNEIYSFKDRFTPVGERNNVAGSKIFKKLIEEKNYTKALEIARTQIEKGAAVIDINMDDGLLISHEEIEKYLRVIQNDPLASKVPVMIDSSDFKTIETALKNTAGKSIVNSISLKEGEEIFRKKALIIKKYGAAVIAMAFDEKGQGVSYERKIEICSRSYKILKELGFNDWDIIFDPNILAVGTGSESDRFNGINYIKAVCWIKENLKCGGVVGGLSNLSFSFRGNNALRASIHSVFLKTAKKEGMNFAIMNSGESAPELSEHEISVIEKLLRGEENSLDEILSLSVKKTDTVKKENLEDNFYNRIHKALIYGGSTSFENDISEALNTFSPIEVIQNILMPGMEKVGSMFEKGELYLPQLIRSASVMNKAVDIITPLLAGNEKIQSKGKIIMATVEGDVHDIGKNITGTVLKCSGFEIIDLGVMVSKEKIFETAVKEKADVVTLSGLISPSLKEMEKVLNLFNENSLNIPVIIAGAAASMLHTSIKLAPIYRNKTLYAADALDTLTAAEMLCSDKKDNFLKEKADELNKIAKIYYDNNKNKSIENKPSAEGSNDKFLSPVSSPLKTGKDFIEFSIKDTEPFIKYGLIFHNLKVKDTKEEKEVEKDIKMILDTMKKEKLTVKCSFGIFPCKKNEDSITITENQKNFSIPLKRGIYKPQSTSLSLSDFFNKEDYIGAFTISVFSNFFKDNDYLSLLETLVLTRIAEAGAECLQKYIDKNLWKINIRPVPGYPSLPDHSIKKTIFDLIEGERTGATLTSSFAMTPLSSVCGLYVSNPKSFYFNLD